jgi:glutathione S-transferase
LPLTGRDADPDEVATGLIESDRLAANLESLAGDGGYLVGHSLTLADLHLAPMIAYLTSVPAGRAQLGQRPKLLAWWGMVRCRPAFIQTQPRFPAAAI